MHAVNDQPYKAIISTASMKGCDLIFMASHGWMGLSALILGSETKQGVDSQQDPGAGVPMKTAGLFSVAPLFIVLNFGKGEKSWQIC